MLYNPAYTGTYVFGRYKHRKRLDPNGMFKYQVVRMPQDQWEVIIPDHHPAYISWKQYEDNLRQLQQNRTNAEVSGPAREGWALLQGLLLCGRCGCRMTVRYTGNGGISPRYECRRRLEKGSKTTCSSLRCEPVDRAIEARIMDALQPAHLELALLALDKVLSQEDELEMSWKLSIERTQYEADRAQRQYDLAEPENRLVVGSLEARWNEKLAVLNNLREDYDRYRASRVWCPTAKDREDILALAKDLPRIWNAPTTGHKDRKRIVRLLIEDITVNCQAGNKDVSLGIRWRSDCCEVLHVTKPLPPNISRKHPGDTVELIGSLARNMTDCQIAKYLNDSGHRTPENKLFTKNSVSWLRYRYRIKGPTHDGLTVKETANHFGISTHVVYYWLDHGLKGTKFAPGWPWIISIDDDTEKTLSDWVRKSKTNFKFSMFKA